jgi:hypothetical protein
MDSMSDWREYQEEIAELFRSLGCHADVEKRVKGARAFHTIDVWVEFAHFGLEHHWGVECKNWKRPVTKEKVLAFKSVIDDVGAERGIFVAESGFQPGAWQAASFTNMDLTTLDDLKKITTSDFLKITLVSLEKKIDLLSRDITLHASADDQSTSEAIQVFPNPDIDTKACFRALEELSWLNLSIKYLRGGGDPSIVYMTDDGPVVDFFSIDEFFDEAHLIVCRIEKWWQQEKSTTGVE